ADHLVLVEPPLAGRGLVLELVLVVGLLAHELARAGHPHALGRALVGLLLRHVLVLFAGVGPRSSTELPHGTGRLGGAVLRFRPGAGRVRRWAPAVRQPAAPPPAARPPAARPLTGRPSARRPSRPSAPPWPAGARPARRAEPAAPASA